jgi:hypothetical protein
MEKMTPAGMSVNKNVRKMTTSGVDSQRSAASFSTKTGASYSIGQVYSNSGIDESYQVKKTYPKQTVNTR